MDLPPLRHGSGIGAGHSTARKRPLSYGLLQSFRRGKNRNFIEGARRIISSIQALSSTLNGTADERTQRAAEQLMRQKLGAYAPSRGPMRLERFAIADRIVNLNASGRMSPAMVQQCLQMYQATQSQATSAKDEESKEALAGKVRYLQQFMNIQAGSRKAVRKAQ